MTQTPITLEQALRDGNSSVNQRIKEKFVSRDVYCSVNSLVEYSLKHGFEDPDAPVSLDSIENYYTYPEYRGKYAKFDGGTKDQRDAEIERLKELQSEYDVDEEDVNFTENEKIYNTIRDEIAELEALESEPQEILEWWAVSNWLMEKLKDQGEPVVDTGSCAVWGRTTSGQAILLDGVITRICADMEILDGQAHSWKD